MSNILRAYLGLDKEPEEETPTQEPEKPKRAKKVKPDPSEFKHRIAATLRTHADVLVGKEEEE